MISDRIINDIKTRADIVRILKNEGLPLVQKGSTFTCCCPFHPEDTPSFVVDPRRQTYKCWGASCPTNGQPPGDVFTFFKQRDGMDFKQSLRHVAQLVHLEHLLPKE